MNWVDVLILVVLCVSSFYSLRAGFLRQTFAVLGFVVGIYTALSHHQRVAEFLSSAVTQPTLAKAVAFVLILVAVWIASSMLAALAREALIATGLAWVDSLFGMLLGLSVGLVVVVSLLVVLVRLSFLGVGSTVEQSFLASAIFKLLPHLTQLLPSGVRILRMVRFGLIP